VTPSAGFLAAGMKAIRLPGFPVAGLAHWHQPGSPNPIQLRGQHRPCTDFPSPNGAPNLAGLPKMPKVILGT